MIYIIQRFIKSRIYYFQHFNLVPNFKSKERLFCFQQIINLKLEIKYLSFEGVLQSIIMLER